MLKNHHLFTCKLWVSLCCMVCLSPMASAQVGKTIPVPKTRTGLYEPTYDNLEARKAFVKHRLGIFLHWGIYSVYGQGEWYLNSGGLHKDEYAKAASAFYPWRFNPEAWAKAFRDAGAGYVTFTTRHHDGFSMFHTAESNYNIVDATPYHRDVLKMLAEAVHQEGLDLHLYYSILDWIRPDYPLGRTGLHTGRVSKPDYAHYMEFMKRQIKELLSNYGSVKALWFDGYWDHDQDSVPFNWHMPTFYRYIHKINSACLIGNNHHLLPLEGEDFQMFERDQPGENKAGLSGQAISKLPLEMCQTMNGMWGYKVADTNYKSVPDLIHMLVRAASKSCNLLLNIGPQPDGELPAKALERLEGIGKWMRVYGNTVNGTVGGPFGEQQWGVSTQRDDTVFVHVLQPMQTISLPMERKPRKVVSYADRCDMKWKYDRRARAINITLSHPVSIPDFVIEIEGYRRLK